MADGEATVRCGKCGGVLVQSPNLPVEERQPCGECQSLARKVEMRLEGEVTLHSHLSIKAKHGGRGKPFITGKFGHDLHRKTGRWSQREMTVDRDNNRYRERIVDLETDEVIRDVDEPLDRHRGRGSARKKQS